MPAREPSGERMRGAFWGAIIGDALATPMNGLSKGHIHSIFREISGYTDPGPALKGKENSWKKPGLYTAPTQLALLLAVLEGKSRRGDNDPASHIAAAAQQGGGTCGIFRHPDALLLDLIRHCQARSEGREQSRDPRIDFLPPLQIFLPLLALRPRHGPALLLDSLKAARFITLDYHAISAVAMLISILEALFANPEPKALLELVIDTSRNTLKLIRDNPAPTFDLKLNPDTLAEKASHVADSIELLHKATSLPDAEQLICVHARTLLKHNLTRATVNHPLTLAPYALAYFTGFREDTARGFFTAAAEGGGAGTLASTAGTLWGALYGAEQMPGELKDGLVNKTRVGNYIDSVASGKSGAVTLKDFFDSESALTRKEHEELQAKLKHVKVKEKKQKSGQDRERELNRHVVESWTKIDKAKWKKRKKDDYSE